MAAPSHCPMCGHDGQALTRQSMMSWECPACGEITVVRSDDTAFDKSLLEIPLLTIGEVLTWVGAMQASFLLAIVVLGTHTSSPWLLIWCVVGLLATACQIWGGWQMARRRWYWWAVAGGVAAMLPFSCAWVLCAPLGVWALCLLSLRDVRGEFL